jgi:hypothetical protein
MDEEPLHLATSFVKDGYIVLLVTPHISLFALDWAGYLSTSTGHLTVDTLRSVYLHGSRSQAPVKGHELVHQAFPGEVSDWLFLLQSLAASSSPGLCACRDPALLSCTR